MAAVERPHMEAMTNERAAFFQLKQGNRTEAEKYFWKSNASLQIWMEW